MITKEQAMTAHDFHENHSAIIRVGPRGGKTMPKIFNWRRNGQTKTWKREPDHFRIPVKHGMRSYSYITQMDAHMFHAAEKCPKMILSTDLIEDTKFLDRT
jgi:hypothetical protein